MTLTWAHVHLAVNHFPVVGAVLALAFLIWAVSLGEQGHVRMALVFFVVVAVMGVATFFTGEPAEHVVEDLAGFSEPLMEEHEEVARTSTIILVVTGLMAALGLFLGRESRALPRWFTPAFLVLALAASGAMAWTASLGGQIRHSEIRPGFEAAPVHPEEDEAPGG